MAENKKRRIETSITRTINMGNYESIKIGCVISSVIQDKADVTTEFEKLWKICESELEAQSNNYEPNEPFDPDSRVEPGTETDTTKEVEPNPEPENDITEEQIMAMKKPDLIKLIASEKIEGLDTSVGVKALRVMVVEEMFEDDTPEPEPETKPEDDGPEEDEIMAMGKDDLIALIEKEKLEIDTSKSEKVLRVMIVDALFEDDEEEAAAGGTAEESKPEAGGTEGVPGGGEWKDDDWE